MQQQTEIKTQEQLYAGRGSTAADLGDTLTTAERMAQFEPTRGIADGTYIIRTEELQRELGKMRKLIREGAADLTDLTPYSDSINAEIERRQAERLHRIFHDARPGQLVDFDIEGHGQATCWLNDREIRLEFRYWRPEEGQDTLDIAGAEYGPTDNWAKVELTKEQEQAAEATLLPMYVKRLDARTED